MSQSPIPRVLSTFRRHRVKALLMGGQACILYGAAEFTRDVDFAVAVGPENLDRLKRFRDQGIARAVVTLPSAKGDEILPVLDRWAELIRQTAH